jgi:hypothetical protein
VFRFYSLSAVHVSHRLILPAYAEPSAEPAGLNARIVAMPALSPG